MLTSRETIDTTTDASAPTAYLASSTTEYDGESWTIGAIAARRVVGLGKRTPQESEQHKRDSLGRLRRFKPKCKSHDEPDQRDWNRPQSDR